MTGGQAAPVGATVLRGYLLPDERILWEGQPEVRAFMLRGWWFILPFSILWGGFAIFWEVSAAASGAPPFFLLFGVPFVLIGLYMIFGRFYVAAREAENTSYAITDSRVLILGGAFRPSLIELDLVNLPGAQLDEGPHGVGTITFGQMSGYLRMPPGWPTFGMYRMPPAFQSIRDCRRVFETLQQTRANLRAEGVRAPA